MEVISEGRLGILGIGAVEARVMVRPLTPVTDVTEEAYPPSITATPPAVDAAIEALTTLLDLMSIRAGVTVRPPQTPGDGSVAAVLDVRGEDLGILIGRRGETLAALQYIVNLIASRKTKGGATIGIDVADYRRRREEHLRSLALRMAERVKTNGRPITLEPMPSAERRIIHITLARDNDIVTSSFGQGDHRKVTIALRRQQSR